MNAILRIQNCYTWVNTTKEISSYLWRAFRHREKNYFHSRLYKQGIWDGYTEFYKKESGRILTGLLPELKAVLKHLGCEYEIQDERTTFKLRYNQIEENFLDQWSDEPYLLRDYQVDLTNKILKHRRGIIQAPTSAGKTSIMLATLKALPERCPTLILANRKSLVSQNYDYLEEWKFPNIGRLYGSYKQPNIMTCATVQSLHKMEALLPKIRCLIVDEIQDMMSKKPTKYYNKMKNCDFRLAVSATPFKFGGTDKTQKLSVKGYFGPVMQTSVVEGGVLTTKFLQERGNLAKSRCIIYPIHNPELPYDTYQDAVTNGIALNWEFHDIVKRLAMSLTGRTLIIVERLAHGDALASMIPGALWVQGKDDLETRKTVITKLQEEKQCVAIATQGIFNTGINVFVHNLINAAGGKAEHQIIQRLGRGLRTASDKELLMYYDFIFFINEYLLKHSKKRVKTMKEEGHLVELREQIDF